MANSGRGGSNQGPNSYSVAPTWQQVWQPNNATLPPNHGAIAQPVTAGTNRILDATTSTFPPGWSVTRAAGGATYLDSSGVLQTASANTARIDYIYNGTTWVVGGLLVEPASANSVPSFTGSLANASLGTNVTGIDGTADAIPVIPNTSSAAHAFVLGSPPTTAQAVFSVIAKANTYAQAGLRENASSGSSAAFALSGSGSVINTDKQGSIVPSNATIQALGNSRYRISFVLTNASAIAMSLALYPLSGYSSGDVQGFNWAGNGTDSVIFDKPVIEAGTGTLTSVIPTGGSRAADVITFTLGSSATQLTFTFDDGSIQTITGLASGSTYTIPTYLNRSRILYIDDNSPVTTYVGAAAGDNAATAVGAWLQSGVGSSAGTDIAAATGAWLQAGVGSAAGSNTATATGHWLQSGVGSSAGSNTATATGSWLQAGVGSSAGANTATAVGAWLQAGVGSSAGANTATATGAKLQIGVASSVGANTSTATGQAIFNAAGSSAGTNTSSVTAAWLQSGVGSSAGTDTATAVGTSGGIVTGDGLSIGDNIATAIGAWLQSGVGSSVGGNVASGSVSAVEADFNNDFAQDFSGFPGAQTGAGQGDFNTDFNDDFAVFHVGQVVSGVGTSVGGNIAEAVGSTIVFIPPVYPPPPPVPVKIWHPAQEYHRVQAPRANRTFRHEQEYHKVQVPRANRVYRHGTDLKRLPPRIMKRRYG